VRRWETPTLWGLLESANISHRTMYVSMTTAVYKNPVIPSVMYSSQNHLESTSIGCLVCIAADAVWVV
jgi:hypothetical protein